MVMRVGLAVTVDVGVNVFVAVGEDVMVAEAASVLVGWAARVCSSARTNLASASAVSATIVTANSSAICAISFVDGPQETRMPEAKRSSNKAYFMPTCYNTISFATTMKGLCRYLGNPHDPAPTDM